MTSGKIRRRLERARIAQKLATNYAERAATAAAELGGDFIAHKSDEQARAFLASTARAITNAGALNIMPAYGMCIRCSARPVVSSVNSRAAYCEQHWARLWQDGT